MKRLTLTLLCALSATLPAAALAAQSTPVTVQEIEHLLDYLKNSSCQFMRNGSWYDSSKAAEHLRQKYDYLLNKGLVASAEDFIARAASESSISHQPYQVRCAGKEAEPSGPWLQVELKRYQASRQPVR
jgi:hypothetical protein